MLLLRRFLPFLVAIASACLLFVQARSAETYPWVAVIAPSVLVFAGVFIGFKRVPLRELMARLLPSVLALAGAVYALLLTEGVFSLWVIPVLGAGISYLVLELLFLHVFLPARYPVNGLSRLNFALVPIVFWFAMAASVGLVMFVHAERSLPILVLAGAGTALFWSTAHADADAVHRRRWALIGGGLGIQLGILGAFLPLTIFLQGGYAAVLAGFTLRARRYGMAPYPSRSLVLGETLGMLILLIAMLTTARWI